jgi:2-amino-4-hydroxy-6-hydroxymethyldihydropteridine diphosphokinase
LRWNILNIEDESQPVYNFSGFLARGSAGRHGRDFELVVLSFGSNRGRRFNYVKNAVEKLSLSGDFNLIAVSNLYETEPWGFKNQKKFLNCTAAGLSKLNLGAFFGLIKNIECQLGRVPGKKWREREIDIDLLFYGTSILKTGRLVIPHPYLHERNFVLVPLTEMMPSFVHPLLGKTIRQLLKQSKDKTGVRLYHRQLFGV